MTLQLMFQSARASLFFLTVVAFSAVRAGDCGRAEVVEGQECGQIKVRFTFEGCEEPSEPKQAEIVSCREGIVKAQLRSGGRTYQSELLATSNGWYKTWASASLNESAKKKAPRAASPATPVAVTVAPSPVPLAPANDTPLTVAPSPMNPSTPVRFQAFADFRFRTVSDDDEATDRNPESGFLLEDAALYVNLSRATVDFFIDLPFSRAKTASGNTPDFTKSDSADFDFAKGKAQAYGVVRVAESVSLTVGQFDTVFGFELNDSKDRFFSQTGVVYNDLLPVTHSGVVVQTSTGGWTFRGLAANPNNRGSFGTRNADVPNTEYGATVGYASANFRFQLGGLARAKNDVAGEPATRSLVDLTAGVTFGSWTCDLEVGQVNDPAKDLDADGKSDPAGTGALVHVVHQTTDDLQLGARLEKTDRDPLNGGQFSSSTASFGFKFALADDTFLRGEHVSYSLVASEGAKAAPVGISSLGLQFSF